MSMKIVLLHYSGHGYWDGDRCIGVGRDIHGIHVCHIVIAIFVQPVRFDGMGRFSCVLFLLHLPS